MASELLKVAYANAASNSEVKLIDGASGHTYTVLSITICETAGAAETFDLYVDNDDGGNSATMDFLSNGFKIRRTGNFINVDGSVYVYMAFAESPFVSSEGVPTTAR